MDLPTKRLEAPAWMSAPASRNDSMILSRSATATGERASAASWPEMACWQSLALVSGSEASHSWQLFASRNLSSAPETGDESAISHLHARLAAQINNTRRRGAENSRAPSDHH